MKVWEVFLKENIHIFYKTLIAAITKAKESPNNFRHNFSICWTQNTNYSTQYFLLTTISDNTTLFFDDNITDAALGAPIIDVNDPMPKPKKLPGHYWGLGKVKNVLR